MFVWRYKILTDVGMIITRNPEYAEEKSKRGCLVFCKRENNVYKFNH